VTGVEGVTLRQICAILYTERQEAAFDSLTKAQYYI